MARLSVASARLLEPLLAAVFDARCLGCDVALAAPREGPLCAACWTALPRHPEDTCGCGALLHEGIACPRCRRATNPLRRGASLGPHAGLLRRLVHAFKYEGRRRLAPTLAARLVREPAVRQVLEGDVVLVPVPLHPRRERERGFNQCTLLAQALAGVTGLPVCRDALVRLRDTSAQAGLTAASRRANVEGAFAVRRRCGLGGRVVVLVEDVVTTGATVRACASALLRSGVAEVRLVAIARVA
jgi:ComF family protein